MYPFTLKLGVYDPWLEHWERNLYKLDKLSEIPKMKEPTFVFAHFLIPHGPYEFDRKGNLLPEEVVKKRSEKENN